jgi:hypothetical protein
MFTWICPQCGREVPPAYTECPDCTGKNADTAPPQAAVPQATGPAPLQSAAAEPAPPAATTATRRRPLWSTATAAPPERGGFATHAQPVATAPPPPPVMHTAPQAPPPEPPPPAEPAFAPAFSAVVVPPARKRGLPTWLLTVLFAAGFVGIVFGVYKLVNRAPAAPAAAVESPAAKPGAPVNPIQRFVEIAGVRFVEDPKHKDQTIVRFLLVNHSDADLTGVGGNVTLWGSTRHSEEDAEGSFTFNTDLKSNESKELTEPLNTKKKIYELPDWQNLTADLQVTSPAAGSPAQ